MIPKGFFIALVFLGFAPPVSAQTQPPDAKYVVILADFGGNAPPPDVLSAIARRPGLKITLPWESDKKLPENIARLVRDRKAELALSFPNEPLMPLVYETEISSPVAIKFAWPEDVWNMVFRAREEFFQNTQSQARGMYLRSGLFNSAMSSGLLRLGIHWCNSKASSGGRSGIFLSNGMTVLSSEKKTFSSAASCWEWINSSDAKFIALDLSGTSGLNGDFFNVLGAYFDQSVSVKAVTPEALIAKFKGRIEEAAPGSVDPDLSFWTGFPLIWHELSVVRKMIEDYKNSGSAKLATLDALRDQLYTLYGYGLIDSIVRDPSTGTQAPFQNGVANIYTLLGLPLDESVKALPGLPQGQERQFALESAADSLVITNSASSRQGKGICRLSVSVSKESVAYFVDLDTTAVQQPFVADIYMDLNNQEGAGLTKLLPGQDAFMEVNDAWEYALRLERDKAVLFRAGRFEPVQLKQFASQIPWEVEVPRNILRGNPLSWGYQAVTAVKRADGTGYEINDFLVKDDDKRTRLFGAAAMQLPAVRARNFRQGKTPAEEN